MKRKPDQQIREAIEYLERWQLRPFADLLRWSIGEKQDEWSWKKGKFIGEKKR